MSRAAEDRRAEVAGGRSAAPAPRVPTAPFLSPGAVGHLSRQLVERIVGRDPSVHAWRAGGPLLLGEPPPGELARRLAETDVAYLTDGELEAYVRACSSLGSWVAVRSDAARSELAARSPEPRPRRS